MGQVLCYGPRAGIFYDHNTNFYCRLTIPSFNTTIAKFSIRNTRNDNKPSYFL